MSKVGRQGEKQSPAFWAAMGKRWITVSEEGMTFVEFCASEGVSVSSARMWFKKYGFRVATRKGGGRRGEYLTKTRPGT